MVATLGRGENFLGKGKSEYGGRERASENRSWPNHPPLERDPDVERIGAQVKT